MLPKVILLFALTTSVLGVSKLSLPPYKDEQIASEDVDQSRIVGGEPAEVGEFPYQVCLRGVESGWPFCGGTIITKKHILTAAHCVPPNIPEFYVYSGSNKLSTGGVRHPIDHVKIHEDYKEIGAYNINDIAIVTLKTEIQFNSVTKPATIPTYPTANGVAAKASGWGRYKSDIPTPHDELMKLPYYPIFDLAECMKIPPESPIHYGKICAFGSNGRGVCFGDSGGPLSVNGAVIGIVSYGKGSCAIGKPDVFTNVFHYLSWIIINTPSLSDELLLV